MREPRFIPPGPCDVGAHCHCVCHLDHIRQGICIDQPVYAMAADRIVDEVPLCQPCYVARGGDYHLAAR